MRGTRINSDMATLLYLYRWW